MPQDNIYLRDELIQVRWSKSKQALELKVAAKEDDYSNSISACLDNEKDLSKLIRSLKRARRQMFWQRRM